MLSENQGTYSELALEVGNGGDIVLNKSLYTYDFGDTIVINQSGVIDGRGCCYRYGRFT